MKIPLRYKTWGGKDPYRAAEDVAFAVARFFQAGGVFQNYYMVDYFVNPNSKLSHLCILQLRFYNELFQAQFIDTFF